VPHELRVAIRELIRARGYTLTAVLTLSCAIAATASILGAAYAVLRLPSSIQRPGDLVVTWSSAPDRGVPVVEVTYRQFVEWAASDTVDQAAAFGSSHWPMVVESGSEPARWAVTGVSASFFDTLGARPLLGRSVTPADDGLSSGWVGVFSCRVWRDRYGADPAIVGRAVRLEGKLFTIVGVMPEDFDVPRATDLWTPVVPLLNEVSQRAGLDAIERIGVLYVLGRMAPTASIETVDPITWAVALIGTCAAVLGASFAMARRAVDANPASILNAP